MHNVNRNRSRSLQQGFTLLEVIIALALATMIIGLTVLSLDTISDERRLRKPPAELRQMARDAMRLSMKHQRSYSILMNQNFIMLRETNVASEDSAAAGG